uniref:non-specific serine/threonine protein kinase n=1 Tax=Strongyloides venezuelensis TaxID=75913 RepID=A0A0K0EZ97_STRVS
MISPVPAQKTCSSKSIKNEKRDNNKGDKPSSNEGNVPNNGAKMTISTEKTTNVGEKVPTVGAKLVSTNLDELNKGSKPSKGAYPEFDNLLGRRVKGWKAESIIGKGTYGVIYKCSRSNDVKNGQESKSFGALKAEVKKKDKHVSMKEVHILQILQTKPETKHHFPHVFEYGEKRNFKYLITTLYGRNLYDVLINTPGQTLKKNTWIRVIINVFEGLRLLHNTNIVHLDIKPANIILDYEGTKRYKNIIVRIIDFGLSKHVRYDCENKLIPANIEPESPIKENEGPIWVGSIFHCSPYIHKGYKPTYRDDIYSWLYLAMDLFKELPWSPADPEPQIVKKKLEATYDLYKGYLPPEFGDALRTIYNAKPNENIDYSLLKKELDRIMVYYNVSWDEPCQWEPNYNEKEVANKPMVIQLDKADLPNTVKDKIVEDDAPALRIKVQGVKPEKDNKPKNKKKTSFRKTSRKKNPFKKLLSIEKTKYDTEDCE